MARKKTDQKSKNRGIAFAKSIKNAREQKAMTQQMLADSSNVSIDTLRSIENYRILCPNVFIAADIVTALNESLDAWIAKINEESANKNEK